MAMNELRKEVEAAAMAELNRANAKFPLFNSTHEGYAVILEDTTPTAIFHQAIDAACEMVQTAAMLLKYEMSLGAKAGEKGENTHGDLCG